MRIESSSEFQGVVLSTVIKDTYMFTRTSRFINDTFFDKYSYKLIYKSLKYYYDKYSKLPTLTELLILISDFHNPQLGDVELIKQECQTLYDTPRYDENFVIDKITTFIRRNNVENVLKSALPKLNQGDSIAIDSLGEELMKGLNFNLGKSTSFRLSDISEISAIRRAAIGTDDNPLIIKSCMDGINQSLQFKGYKPGDLIMICLVGSTKIMTLDGKSHTIEELYEMKKKGVKKGIYTIDPYEMHKNKYCAIEPTNYEDVVLTKYINDTIKVILDNGAVIECTPDHRFLLRSGEYVEARNLKQFAELASFNTLINDIEKNEEYNAYVVSVEKIYYEEAIPVYDIINSGPYNNFAIDVGDESGIFVHNCAAPGVGKTMFMINEGANASIQGFKVLHLFLGDMKEYDGFVRYTSRYTQIPQDDIVAMPIDQQQALIRKFNLQGFFSNVVVAAYAAGEITIEEMVQEVYRLQDENHMHFDMILVDYADNLIPDSDMMYESGGNIYNKLSLLGSKNRSVILVGSQPKPSYWGEEIIPKEAAAESSRKQHVIDVMITMGMTSKGSTVGSLFLPKVRRGVEGKIIRIKTYFEKAYLEAIPETDYLREKSS